MSGSIDSPVQRNGGQYVFYTDLNGVVSGTNECWSTIDRLFMNETLHGSQSIQGIVTRNNLPLENAIVTRFEHGDVNDHAMAHTDADGHYRFSNLSENKVYDIMASFESNGAYYTSLARAGVAPRFIPDP